MRSLSEIPIGGAFKYDGREGIRLKDQVDQFCVIWRDQVDSLLYHERFLFKDIEVEAL